MRTQCQSWDCSSYVLLSASTRSRPKVAENRGPDHRTANWYAACLFPSEQRELLCGSFDSHYGGPTPSW